MNIDAAFPSKYLKAADVEGDDLALTIKSVTIEEIGQGEKQETKPILYFTETDKGLVLNKTNAGTISNLYTRETDNWIGKKISLFATEVDMAGKQTLALRVRMKAPKQAQTSQPKPNGNGDATTAFWAFAYQHEISKVDATAYLNEAGNDFAKALQLMQEQNQPA